MPTATYYGISTNQWKYMEEGFGGSSSLNYVSTPNYFVNHTTNKSLQVKTRQKKERIPTSSKNEKKIPATYKLKKSKFAKKLNAFTDLTTSQKFMAFYSISFPMHISDRVAMKCLNIWLTRIRKTYPEFKYIWVAERQKKNKDNQTIHFHLVTNQYMKIKTVNWWMAKSIDNCVKDGLCSWGKGSLGMYNGVDVRPIYNKAGVDMYLKKYCSKNDDEFQVRPWGCCRMVSALFTVVNVTQEWFEKMRDRGWIKNEVDGVKKYIEGVGWKYYNWAVERSGISKKTGKIWKAVVTPKSVRDKIRWINDQVESFYGNIIYAESRAALAI